MDTTGVSAIILAAGASTRFGSNKLAHRMTWHHATLSVLAHSIRPWLDVFPTVHVVTSAANSGLQAMLADELPHAHRVQWLLCDEATAGMGRSLASGVHHCGDAAGWLIGLGDMPYLQAETIRAVKTAMEDGAALAAPYCDGKRGHPIGFSREFGAELLQLHGDQGAKGILAAHADAIQRIGTADSGILMDIDEITDIRVEQPDAA